MNGHPNIDRAEAVEQIKLGVEALADNFHAVFEPRDGWPEDAEVDRVIVAYWTGIQGALGEQVAREFATQIVRHLLPHEARDSTFWKTGLGRQCAWWIGYTHEAVPQQVAANIMGVTRQVITKLIQRGRLATIAVNGAPAHIDREALIQRLHRQNA